MKKILLIIFTLLLFLDSRGQQTANSYVSTFYSKATIGYYVYLPPNYSTSAKLPLLLFLHGTGEAGKVLSNTLIEGVPPRLIQDGKINGYSNFIVVSPQSPYANWDPRFIDEVLEKIKATYKVDTNRVYVTGLSSGGKGTWNYAISYPNKVTAILTIASPNVSPDVCKAKDIPVWSFQGSLDGKSETSWSKAYNACIPAPKIPGKLTVINGAAHDTRLWGTVYSCNPVSPDGSLNGLKKDTIFNWLLQYSKKVEVPLIKPTVELGDDITYIQDRFPILITIPSNAADSDGTIVSYRWKQISGPAELYIDSTQANLSIIENTLPAGVYTFNLTVTDNSGLTATDQISVIIKQPSAMYRINSGGGVVTDSKGTWEIDQQLTSCPYIDLTGNNYTTGALTWTGTNTTEAPNNIFGNNRYGKTKPAKYKFPVMNGRYIVKLYFNDKGGSVGTRKFNVLIENSLVISNFDIFAEYGASAAQKNFTILVNDGELNISFEPILGNARIDGIEIYSIE